MEDIGKDALCGPQGDHWWDTAIDDVVQDAEGVVCVGGIAGALCLFTGGAGCFAEVAADAIKGALEADLQLKTGLADFINGILSDFGAGTKTTEVLTDIIIGALDASSLPAVLCTLLQTEICG